MPDTAQFSAPDTPKINWLYVGGGIFGVIVLIYLMNRSKSTSGTVAAGTSINAALGSVQEQLLNLQGSQSVGNVALANEATAIGQANQLGSAAQESENLANFTYLFAGPNDPRIQAWQVQAAQQFKAAQDILNTSHQQALASVPMGI